MPSPTPPLEKIRQYIRKQRVAIVSAFIAVFVLFLLVKESNDLKRQSENLTYILHPIVPIKVSGTIGVRLDTTLKKTALSYFEDVQKKAERAENLSSFQQANDMKLTGSTLQYSSYKPSASLNVSRDSLAQAMNKLNRYLFQTVFPQLSFRNLRKAYDGVTRDDFYFESFGPDYTLNESFEGGYELNIQKGEIEFHFSFKPHFSPGKLKSLYALKDDELQIEARNILLEKSDASYKTGMYHLYSLELACGNEYNDFYWADSFVKEGNYFFAPIQQMLNNYTDN